MTEMCPRSSVSVVTDATGGGLPDGTGAVGQRWASSNASPAKNFARQVSGVVLNNLCPTSQNPVTGHNVSRRTVNEDDDPVSYLLRGRSQ